MHSAVTDAIRSPRFISAVAMFWWIIAGVKPVSAIKGRRNKAANSRKPTAVTMLGSP